jgi:cell division protein FtsZ
MNTDPILPEANEVPAGTDLPSLSDDPIAQASAKKLCIKIFGVGNAGIKVLEQIVRRGFSNAVAVAVDVDSHALAESSATEKVHLETPLLRGLGSGGDPERGGAIAEEQLSQLKSLCFGADVIFIIAGLAGGAGTGITPVLARAAKEAGALVLAFVTTPFECEGNRRHELALEGLAEIKAAADGVICLPNQKVFKLIDENTSVLETFKITGDLLADAVRGVWRLLAHSGLIEIHFSDLCELLRDRHAESSFAVAEAMGPTRSREVMDKLLAHPMLDGGQVLEQSEAVLVSLMGGPDLTMAEVNRVIEQIQSHCEHARVIMGAVIDETFRERLAVTLIAARKSPESRQVQARHQLRPEELETQLLTQSDTARPSSRFVPPPPALPPEQMEKLLARHRAGAARQRKAATKMKQSQLPLEIVSKGRFDKSEPTIHKGEDLDVPTYIRRGVALN